MIDYAQYISLIIAIFIMIAILIDIINKLRKNNIKIKMTDYIMLIIFLPFILISYISKIRYVNPKNIYLSNKELSKGVDKKNLSYIKYRKSIKYIAVFRDDYVSTYHYFIPFLRLYLKREIFGGFSIADKEDLIEFINPKEQIKSMVSINKFNL